MKKQDYKTLLQEQYLNLEERQILKELKDNQDKYLKLPIGDF